MAPTTKTNVYYFFNEHCDLIYFFLFLFVNRKSNGIDQSKRKSGTHKLNRFFRKFQTFATFNGNFYCIFIFGTKRRIHRNSLYVFNRIQKILVEFHRVRFVVSNVVNEVKSIWSIRKFPIKLSIMPVKCFSLISSSIHHHVFFLTCSS